MDKSDQHIDQIFQQRLKDAAVPPPAFVWAGVEKELNKRKKRPAGIWWWTSGVALLVAAGIWYFAGDHQVVSTPDRIADAPALAVPEQYTADSKQRAATTPDHAVAGSATIPASAPAGESTASATAVPAGAGKPSNGPGVSDRKTVIQPNLDKKDVFFHKTTIKSNTLPVPVIPAKSTGGSAVNPETIHAAPPMAVNTEAEESADMQSPDLLEVKYGLLETKTTKPSSKNWPVKVARKKKKKNDNCYDFASHRNVMLLEAWAGPVYANKSLHYTNPENEAYQIKRRSSEGQGWGFNGGLRATYLFREHFSVSAGLQYDQFTEVLTYVNPTAVHHLVDHVTDPITGETRLDTLDADFGEAKTRIFNRFGFLDVPVSIGYEVRHGRAGIRFQGGASFNLLFYKRGAVLSPTADVPAYYTPGKGTLDVYNTSSGLSVQSSMQCFYHLNPVTRVFAEPYYREILDPVTVESHPLSQRYRIWGVRMGLAKIF